MPDIPYLVGGEEVTAARLNTLTAEADRRASLALDNHSILYLLGENADVTRTDFAPFLGPTHIFKDGPQPISGYWGTWSYDHSVFTDAISTASELDYPNAGTGIGAPEGGWPVASESQKWVRLNPIAESYFTTIGKLKRDSSGDWRNTTSLLRFSLEAHKRLHTKEDGTDEEFWIEETFSAASDTAGEFARPVYLQRIRQFEQAEIIFEGTGTEAFDFPHNWNKYLFLRFHNLRAGLLVVRFRKADGSIVHTLEVDPYRSKCVRRTAPEGTYTDGYNYFQKFLTGDPRFYQHNTCNNVANPSIIIPFVNRLLAGRTFLDSGLSTHRICIPMVELDPHVRAPLPSGYDSLFAGAADESKLGDNLHHKGALKEIDTGALTLESMSFNGYGTLDQIVETQEVGDDLQIKSRNDRDIIAFSTNLICTEAGAPRIVHPIIDGSQWFTLDRHMPTQLSVRIVEAETEATVSYYSVTDAGGLGEVVNQTITRTTASFNAPEVDADTLRPHLDTIEGAKQRYFDQSQSAATTFSTTAQLTAGGLAILTTQTIPLTAPFAAADVGDLEGRQLSASVISPIFNYNQNPDDLAVQDVLLNSFSIDGQNLVIKRAVIFTDYGFPDCDNWFYTGFLTPRFTRIYSDSSHSAQPTGAGPHPDFDEGAQNVNGEDIKLIAHRAVFKATDIQILSPREEANDYQSGDVGILPNNDVLFGATKNATTAAYWAANRDRLLQNRIYYSDDNDGSAFDHTQGFPDARVMYRFVRMELAVEHYNNLAAKVNSIARYKVLNWIDHGVIQNGTDQTERFRLRPNNYSVLNTVRASGWYAAMSGAEKAAYDLAMGQYAGLRPADQFAAEGAEIVVAEYAGIALRSVLDLPGWTEAIEAKQRIGTLSAVGGSVPLTDEVVSIEDRRASSGFYQVPYSEASPVLIPPSIFERVITHRITVDVESVLANATFSETQTLIRPDLDAVSSYAWLSIESVKDYAKSRGYKFAFVALGAGWNLEVIDAGIGSITPLSPNQQVRVIEERFRYTGCPLDVSSDQTLINSANGTLSLSGALQGRLVEFVPSPAGAWLSFGDLQKSEINTDSASLQVGYSVEVDYQSVNEELPPRYIGSAYAQRTQDASGVPPFSDPPYTVGSTSAPGQYFDATINRWVLIQPCAPGFASVNTRHSIDGFFISAINQAASVAVDLSSEVRKCLWPKPTTFVPATMRNPSDYTSDIICEAPQEVKEISSGLVDSNELVEIPIPWLKFTPEFSETSTAAATARANHGTSVLPFTVEPADGTGNRVMLWADFTQEA